MLQICTGEVHDSHRLPGPELRQMEKSAALPCAIYYLAGLCKQPKWTAAACISRTVTLHAGAKTGGEEPTLVRRLLQRGDLANASHFKGHQVELYWPVDGTWWLARIIKVLGLLDCSCHCTNDSDRAGVTDIAVAT